jgi:PIN domain nuclease of toxin-antitoxin system
MNHTYALQNLPLHHKDPFDRLLVAQAIAGQLPLLSPDEQLSAYDITRLW